MTTRPDRRRQLAIASLLAVAAMAAAVAPCFAQGARLGNVRITVRATPTTLPADGKSRARIRIEVRSRDEQTVADGTPVLCHVDNGLISLSDADKREALTVTTSGGYAIIFCSSETAGPAIVTARVLESRAQVMLQFLPEGEAVRRYARSVNVRADWVAYSIDLNTIQARSRVRATFGALVFDAERLEIRVSDQTMRGRGVRIRRKNEELEGEDFYFELGSRRGVLRRFGEDGLERVTFTAYSLKNPRRPWELPQDAFRQDARESETNLVCRSCSFFLGQKVVVKHAALYAGLQKVFSFPPYWVIGLEGYAGASNTQVLGLTTDGGLAVDFPFFYRVSDEWAGSVKLQRGAAGTSFIARDGWSLGVAEEYERGEAKGVVEASGLFTSDWGLEWRDERPVFGENQGFFSVAWPDHRSLFADASMYHFSDSYRFNARAQYDKVAFGDESYGLNADWLTNSRRLTSGSTYRLGTSLGVRRPPTEGRQWVFSNELYAALDFDQWTIGDNTTITPSISNVYSWDTSDFSANSVRGRLRLARRFGRGARLGLNYYLTYRNGDTSSPGLTQVLGLDLNLTRGSKWTSYVSGSWDITVGDTYAYAAFDYFVKPGWRVGVMVTDYDYEVIQFSDLEFEVGRAIGNREIGLRYSADTGRVSLELGSLGLGR